MAWVQAQDSGVAHWYTSTEVAACDRHPIPPGNARKMVGSDFCEGCKATKNVILG